MEPVCLLDLQICSPQMEDAYNLARSFPDTQIILNHTGMPVDQCARGPRGVARGDGAVGRGAKRSLQISGLGMGDWKWTAESIRPFVLHAIDAFGIDRCMFASNFPVDKLFSSYDELFNAFKAIAEDFCSSSKQLVHDDADQ